MNPLGSTVTKRCSVCGTTFECGAKAASCWCQQLPPLTTVQLDAAADCRCPACLAALTRDLAHGLTADDISEQ